MLKMSSNIIEREITPEMLVKARDLSVEMGRLNNSITFGQGNMAGFLGELLVHDFLQGSELTHTYDYDILYDGLKLDVKTKRTSVKPLDFYECSIADLNTKQDCDYYVFTRVHNDYGKGWILGFIGKQEYFDKATFRRKGEVDPSNKWKVKTDCYNLEISKLERLDEGSSFRHRDRRPEPEEGLGGRDQRPEDRSGVNTKESIL